MSTETLEIAQEEDNKLSPITKFESEIARMKTEYSGLTISGQEDKEGFTKVSNARKNAKALRVEVEHKRKALNEDALKWQRTVNEKAKEITAKIEAIEKPLQELEDNYLAEKERIKAEAARLLKERTQKRAQVITSFDPVKFDGVVYSFGEFSITQAEIESLSNDDFQTRVEAAEVEIQKIVAARIEADRLAKIEADRIEAERIQKEEEAAELKRQQEATAAELQRQKEENEVERKRLEDENAKIEAEKKRVQAESRRVQLSKMGLVDELGDGTHKYKGKVILSQTFFHNLSDELWSGEIVRLNTDIDTIEEEIKTQLLEAEEAEKKRLEDLEAARVEAAEKSRIDTENKAKSDAEAKIKADQATKEKEAKALARRPDIQKQNDMVSQIIAIAGSFSYKTEEGKKMQSEFLQGIDKLIETVGIKEA